MARVMRLVCLFALLLAACSSGSTATAPTVPPRAQHRVRAHYAWARSLQHLVMQRPDHELLDEPGQDLVLELARAQTCLASRTRDEALAEQTQSMLDAYVDLHERHGSEPSRALRRKIRRAHVDAEVAGHGVATPYFLGCEPFDTPDRQRVRMEYIHRDTKGAGPWGRRRSVPGGVIR